ncbi:hypothetical protein LHGZ1_1853 [Laribacter hongkongensis]|uniref:Uncharacterized protein n=1 Tax=Laribacter hongkongensis TaxID=168471 RepID=A0A248LJQ1_9NEIS|nr:hypothetical protein LHGZ1_1853 [Laribacter hongkongensis]
MAACKIFSVQEDDAGHANGVRIRAILDMKCVRSDKEYRHSETN